MSLSNTGNSVKIDHRDSSDDFTAKTATGSEFNDYCEPKKGECVSSPDITSRKIVSTINEKMLSLGLDDVDMGMGRSPDTCIWMIDGPVSRKFQDSDTDSSSNSSESSNNMRKYSKCASYENAQSKSGSETDDNAQKNSSRFVDDNVRKHSASDTDDNVRKGSASDTDDNARKGSASDTDDNAKKDSSEIEDDKLNAHHGSASDTDDNALKDSSGVEDNNARHGSDTDDYARKDNGCCKGENAQKDMGSDMGEDARRDCGCDIGEDAQRESGASTGDYAQKDNIANDNAQTDSDSDRDEEMKHDINAGVHDYRVGNVRFTEKDSKVARHPMLFSQKSFEPNHGKAAVNKEREIDNTDYGDSQEIANMSSSWASSTSGYMIMKRKSVILKIAGETDFFKLQSVKYKHNKRTSRQHYMKRLPEGEQEVEGDIGLRPGDLLLEVNKKSLTNKKQKKVLKVFRQIGPVSDGHIYIDLLLRRWERRSIDTSARVFEVDYQLYLVLEPDIPLKMPKRQSHRLFRGGQRKYNYKVSDIKQHETKTEELPKGQINDIVASKGEKHRIESFQYNGEFVAVDHDGLVSLSVWNEATDTKNVFDFQFFRGLDKSQEPLSQMIYCCRISCSGPLGTRYLTSDIHAHTELIFHISKTVAVTRSDQVDESCFIRRERGRNYLFESLLHRGLYVTCVKGDGDSAKFIMTEKTKTQVIDDTDLDDAKFNLWPVKEMRGTLLNRFVNSSVMDSLFSCAGRTSTRERF